MIGASLQRIFAQFKNARFRACKESRTGRYEMQHRHNKNNMEEITAVRPTAHSAFRLPTDSLNELAALDKHAGVQLSFSVPTSTPNSGSQETVLACAAITLSEPFGFPTGVANFPTDVANRENRSTRHACFLHAKSATNNPLSVQSSVIQIRTQSWGSCMLKCARGSLS